MNESINFQIWPLPFEIGECCGADGALWQRDFLEVLHFGEHRQDIISDLGAVQKERREFLESGKA